MKQKSLTKLFYLVIQASKSQWVDIVDITDTVIINLFAMCSILWSIVKWSTLA